GGDERVFVIRRRLHDKSIVAERNHRDLHYVGLFFDKRFGGGFRGFHAIGVQVGCAHAARNINRQNNGAFGRRNQRRRFGTREGNNHGDEREHEKRRGHMPPPARTVPQRFFDEGQTCVPQRVFLTPALEQNVHHNQHRNQKQQHQHKGPDE